MSLRTAATRMSRTAAVLALLALPAIAVPGQQPATEGTPPIPTFDKTETMVAMRDGVKLHTNIFVPRGFAGNLPIIMIAHAVRHRGRRGDVPQRRTPSWRATATSSSTRTSAGGTSPKGSS